MFLTVSPLGLKALQSMRSGSAYEIQKSAEKVKLKEHESMA